MAASLCLLTLLSTASASASAPPFASASASASAPPFACTSSTDCSLNGLCGADRRCACDAAWRGAHCDVLAFAPAHRGAGYRRVDTTNTSSPTPTAAAATASTTSTTAVNTSSWGASVLYSDSDKRWHMWVAEITNHCGLDAWQSNMRIVHAVSDTAFGHYTFADEVNTSNTEQPVASTAPNSTQRCTHNLSPHHTRTRAVPMPSSLTSARAGTLASLPPNPSTPHPRSCPSSRAIRPSSAGRTVSGS